LRNPAKQKDSAYFAMIREMQAMPNVIFTPHNAFNTQEAVQRKAQHSVQQIEHFLQNGTFLWTIPDE